MKNNSYNGLQDVLSEGRQSRTVRRGGEWILVFKTSMQGSDVIKDLKNLLADLDIEDIRYLDSLLLIGNKKSVKVDSNLVEDLVGDRTKSSVIINRMKEELDRDFGYKLYHRGPHRRLAIRLPIQKIKDFVDEYTPRIKDSILKDSNLTPDDIGDILSVYLIADETYVRLEPETFFQEIFDLKEGAEKESAEPIPTSEIILGESPQELVELALNKLKKYNIYRDIQFVEAAGLPYTFDAFAVLEDDRILIKYMDTITDEDLTLMEPFLDVYGAKCGWILTREPKDGLSLKHRRTDNISIFTIKDL